MEDRIKSAAAAQLLGVSRRRIQQLTRSGTLTSQKEGREHTYSPEQLRREFRTYTSEHPTEQEIGRQKLERARALEGKRVGVLTIGKIAEITDWKIFLWATCDCGNVKRIPFETLAGRKYKSCGGSCKLKGR